jgi:hypothetical protein
VLSQGVQNLLNMLQVFVPSLALNENVIQIHRCKSIGEWSQISSIIIMKVDGAFFKPKGMTNHSKRPSFDLKAGLPYIYLFYRDLVVARIQINLTKVFGPRELIKEVVNSGNRVPVSDCDFIQRLVINAYSTCYIFLMY